MKILVANIASASFRFHLFEIEGASRQEIVVGAVSPIGEGASYSTWTFRLDGQPAQQRISPLFVDHGEAIRYILTQLVASKALKDTADLDAVAFKAPMAGEWAAVSLVDDDLLDEMEFFSPIAPALNPLYILAMNLFREELGDVPLVAVFEPGFHETIPDRRRYYAVPPLWSEKYGVEKYGFHGAAHRYVAERTAELMGPQNARRIISCRLGRSSSVCAILDGASVANSFGLSPQSGLPQAHGAGEFDPFAFALLQARAKLSAQDVLDALGHNSGLAALSGTDGRLREIRAAADAGSDWAQLTWELYVTAVRDYIGAYLAELGGADALVFTGPAGAGQGDLRQAVCENLAFAGIAIDPAANEGGDDERRIEAKDAPIAIYVMPAQEELVVATQAARFLESRQ